VRDPRDVVLSYYNFQRKYRQIGDNHPLANYVSEFVNGRLISADWGTWGENVGSWLARAARPGFLLVRYEDLLTQPVVELGRVASFLGVPSSPDLLSIALQKSSAQRMRDLERAQGAEWVSTKGKREDIPFIGAASAGNWQNKLLPESVAEIENKWGPIMETLGYVLAGTSSGTTRQQFLSRTMNGSRAEEKAPESPAAELRA